MVVQARTLDEWVDVQLRVSTVDDEGHETETWVSEGGEWASIEQLRGAEVIEATSRKGYRSHRIRMRHNPGLSTKHRIVSDGVIYHVDAVVQGYGRARETHAMAVADDG